MLTKNNASANEEASGSIPIGDVGTELEEILIDDDILFQSRKRYTPPAVTNKLKEQTATHCLLTQSIDFVIDARN